MRARFVHLMTTILGVAAAAASGCAGHSATAKRAAEQWPEFDSPDRAVDALVTAVRSGSPDEVVKVLGPDADELVRSGDPVQDKNRVQRFVTRYDQKHEIVPTAEADDLPADQDKADVASSSKSLCIGDSRWPFPIPIVQDGKRWRFDTARGKDEVLDRRIGRNELSTIQVCLAIVDAQRDYISRRAKESGIPEYASKFFSDPDKMNGLYWPAAPGAPESPLGDLVASAADEGYEPGTHQPYHGYFYRILKSQGSHADGGAYDYEVNGKLIGGFAVIARPASYGVSGVMSFIVNHQGVVYQADLGPDTQADASIITSFDPGERWKKVE